MINLFNSFSANGKRGLLIFASAIVAMFVLYFLIAAIFSGDDSVRDEYTAAEIQSQSIPDSSANLTEEQLNSLQTVDAENYSRARDEEGGVAIPTSFSRKDIDTESEVCDCTSINYDALMEALPRALRELGYSPQNDNDGLFNISPSNIYISSDRQLYGENREPLSFKGQSIYLQDNGALVAKNKLPIDGSVIFLSEEGKLFDENNRLINLYGDLLSSKGHIYLSSGFLAFRDNEFNSYGRSDIYSTPDRQLATVDGKPILHAGIFVYVDDENKLINRNNGPIIWEDKPVYVGRTGRLIDAQGESFNASGILFSYNGILIDNDGKLTSPLMTITRRGNSDIYINDDDYLVDEKGNPIKHQGNDVNLRSDGAMYASETGTVKSRMNDEVRLEDDGALTTDIGKRKVETGIFFDSSSVAYDRRGFLVTRLGGISRIASTVIHQTSDGFLVDENGRPILNKGNPLYIDFSNIRGDLLPLVTRDFTSVIYSSVPVYLNQKGWVVDGNDNLLTSGILTNYKGIVITSKGQLILTSSLELVTDKDGNPVTINGQSVYRDENNQLVYQDGRPVTNKNNEALFLGEDGKIRNELGVIQSDDLGLKVGSRKVLPGELTTRKALTSASGENLFYNNKAAFLDANSRVVDEDGNPVLTADGREVFLIDGVLQDADGNVIDEDLLFTKDGRLVKDGIISGLEQIVTSSGKELFYNGQRVFKHPDGTLRDENNNIILDQYGGRVSLNENGDLIDSRGNLFVDDGLVVAGEIIADNEGVIAFKEVTDANGNTLFHEGQAVYTDDKGRLVTEDGELILDDEGNPLYISDDGNIVDASNNVVDNFALEDASGKRISDGIKTGKTQLFSDDGKPLMHNGEPVYINEKGEVVDEFGNVILGNDGKPLRFEGGKILDSGGNVSDVVFTAESRNILDEPLSTVPVGDLKQIGDKDILVSPEGWLLDNEGRQLFVDGLAVRVDPETGQLFDENNNPILDPVTNEPLFLGADGSLRDGKGALASSELLANQEGVLLGTDGVYVTDNLRRVGDSEYFLTESGRVVGEDGKPILFNGEAVIVGENGELVTLSGVPVTNKEGRRVFLDEQTGQLVTSDGSVVDELLLQNSSQQLLTSRGLVAINSADVEPIPGTEYFKASDGSVLKADGSRLEIDGQDVYVNDDNELVNKFGSPFRYKSRALAFNSEGLLTDSQGNVLEDQNGELLTPEQITLELNGNTAQPVVNSTASPTDGVASRDINAPNDTGEINPASTATDSAGDTQKVIEYGEEEFLAALRRYESVKGAMRADIDGYVAAWGQKHQSAQVNLVRPVAESDSSQSNDSEGGVNNNASSNTEKSNSDKEKTIVALANDTLYAVTSYRLNSDFGSDVAVDIVGTSNANIPYTPRQPLYEATAYGNYEERYNHLVISFNRMCFTDGECVSMSGVGIDPSTLELGIRSGVDRHIIYKYGGLMLSTLIQGIAETAGETSNEVTETDTTGTTTTRSGLDEKYLVQRSLGKSGEAFSEVFADNINRPNTVWLAANQDIGIKLFENITR